MNLNISYILGNSASCMNYEYTNSSFCFLIITEFLGEMIHTSSALFPSVFSVGSGVTFAPARHCYQNEKELATSAIAANIPIVIPMFCSVFC